MRFGKIETGVTNMDSPPFYCHIFPGNNAVFDSSPDCIREFNDFDYSTYTNAEDLDQYGHPYLAIDDDPEYFMNEANELPDVEWQPVML